MSIFYHFSHFLEILTGIYFGGFALFGFMQKGASTTIYSKLKDRKNHSIKAQVSMNEYFKVKIKSPADGILNFLKYSSYWVFLILFGKVFNFFMRLGHNEIEKIGPEKENEILLKKYFPSFFFAGCFCLILILLSAFENECSNEYCARAINYFIIYYLLSAFIFHIWGLFIFPFFVNKWDYMHLILVNVIFCGTLTYYSLKYSFHSDMLFNIGWLLKEEGKSTLISLMLFGAAFPLLYVVVKFIIVIFFWEIPILFNITIFRLFRENKTTLEKEISDLTNKSNIS